MKKKTYSFYAHECNVSKVTNLIREVDPCAIISCKWGKLVNRGDINLIEAFMTKKSYEKIMKLITIYKEGLAIKLLEDWVNNDSFFYISENV